MTRVIQKRGEVKAYVCIVSDYKRDDKWHQLVIASHGEDNPMNRARAVAACALLEVLEAELRAPASEYRDQLEAEVVRLIGREPVNKLRKMLAGGG